MLLVDFLLVVLQFTGNFKDLVDFATALSFITSPTVAILNFGLVTGKFPDKRSQSSI
jgi:hypothetical protein